MEPPSSPYLLELSSPYILELLRMLPHKLFRKKQTFLDHTEVPLHNFVLTQIINRVSQKKVYFSKREKELELDGWNKFPLEEQNLQFWTLQ